MSSTAKAQTLDMSVRMFPKLVDGNVTVSMLFSAKAGGRWAGDGHFLRAIQISLSDDVIRSARSPAALVARWWSENRNPTVVVGHPVRYRADLKAGC